MRRLSIFIGMMLVLMMTGTSFAIKFTVEPAAPSVVEGGTVSLSIYLDDWAGPNNVGAVDYYIIYNQTAASIVSVTAPIPPWDDSYFNDATPAPGSGKCGVINYGSGVAGPKMLLQTVVLQCNDGDIDFNFGVNLGSDKRVYDVLGTAYTNVTAASIPINQTNETTSTTTSINICEGNFDDDQDVDGSDAALFKSDFGRSPFHNPCPPYENCPSYFTWCGSECADTTTDEANCGGCNIPCSGTCVAGVCQQGNAPVEKTGQTTLYRTGDDGDIEAGVPWANPRFTILYHYWFIAFNRACDPPTIECENPPNPNNDVVFDNLTGLYWLRDANYFGGTKTWDDAIDSAKSIPFEGVGWRLPNIKEMQSLIDFGQYNPALPSGHPFINVQSGFSWSSTTYAGSTNGAWFVSMGGGYVNVDNKGNVYYVWPVRGGQ